mgnify:CR=1 FL=1|tara:strand:- start:329 stop:631 length:303 start_codon:yes stop_codon:yes gene_type:complete
MVGPHDIGGQNLGPINFSPESKSLLDKRIDVLQRLVGAAGARVYRVDELRFMIEGLSPEMYRKLKYYDRWLYAMYNLLIDKDVLTKKELNQKVNDLKAGS